jgi:hypothetical protein
LRPLALLACGLLGFAGALGLTGGPAVGQTVSLPITTVTVPTLTVPTLTVPTVTSPVPLPSTTVELPGTETVLPGESSGSGSSSSTSSAGAGGETAAEQRRQRSRMSRASRTSGERLRLTDFRVRPARFKNEPRAGGETGTTLYFRLSDPAAVVFRVRQESPRCHGEGAFRAAGRQGQNRVPFLGWVDGERLSPGTYTIRAQARRGRLSSAVRTATFVIVPTHEDVEDSRRAPSRCPQDESVAASSGSRSVTATGGTGSASSAGAAGNSAAGEVLGATANEQAGETPAAPAGEGAQQPSGEVAAREAAGGADGDGFPGFVLEPGRSPLLLLAAILLLALLVAGNAVYGWRLRRAARTQ